MSFKMQMMEQETPEEARIAKIFALDFLCYCETCVLSSECPGQHHAALPVLDLCVFKASSYPYQLQPSPVSLSFFLSCPHLIFSFQMNPSFPAVVTYLTLSPLTACALSLCL